MGYNGGITTMGQRAGGGGGRGMGGGGARSVSGADKYGRMQTFTLQQHLDEYKKYYNQVEAERGETYRKQAAGATTAQLQQLAKGPSGEAQVKAKFAEKVKLVKSGKYDINLANPTDNYVGASFKSAATKGLIQNIAKQELARRRRK